MSQQSTAAPVAYKPIEGLPRYRVGDDGSVWSIRPAGWARMKPNLRKGYLRICLCRDGKQKKFFVHVLVLTAFVGPCPDGMQGRHLDGCRSNCALGNLAWGTPKENAADRDAHGTTARGQKCGRSKLTDADVAEIRRQLAAGRKQLAIGAAFHVHNATISHIHRGYHRKHA